MKKRKLKPFVLPTLYVICITILFVAVITLGSKISKSYSTRTGNKQVKEVIKEKIKPVINTDDTISVSKPFNDERVTISKSFYNKDASDQEKESSIIYYENTYMQNTGVLYSSDDEFEVHACLPGKVTTVKDDDILGKVVYVEYNTNLVVAYYSLSDVNLKVGDQVEQDSIIGKGGTNKLENEKKYSFMIEVYKNGNLMNPLDFYEMNLNELND